MRAAVEDARQCGGVYFEYLSALGLARLEDDGALDLLRKAREAIKAPYPMPLLVEADERLAAG